MTYMTMEEQIAEHINFLRRENFVVEELCIDRGFIRCHSTWKLAGRGEICYQTKKNQLRNGLTGLVTWARVEGGEKKSHRTYGYDFQSNQAGLKPIIPKQEAERDRIERFWQLSSELGEAEYLLKKGVGYYGIRFRNAEYGRVAIIPMRDITGRLRSYQIINPDGSKRFAKEADTKQLMHMLHKPINGFPIGIAESYTTAATCFELTGMAMVVAFSADNLKPVAKALKEWFCDSQILVFGDNDRHLQENKGALAAEGVKRELGESCQVLLPPFDSFPTSREFSDWNDLAREVGVREAREIISLVSSTPSW